MILDWSQLAVIWGAVLFAAVFRAFTGFGFALAAVPALSFTLPPPTTVMLTATLTLIASALSWRGVRAHVDWSQFRPMVACMLPGTLIGVWLLQLLSQGLFQLLAGSIVLVACILLVSTRAGVFKPSIAGSLAAGSVSGLMNGALALPGPPIVIYTMIVEADTRRVRATLIAFFAVSSLAAMAVYSFYGYADRYVFWCLIYSLPVLIAGNFIGEWLFARFGQALFRSAAISALLVIAVGSMLAGMFGN